MGPLCSIFVTSYESVIISKWRSTAGSRVGRYYGYPLLELPRPVASGSSPHVLKSELYFVKLTIWIFLQSGSEPIEVRHLVLYPQDSRLCIDLVFSSSTGSWSSCTRPSPGLGSTSGSLMKTQRSGLLRSDISWRGNLSRLWKRTKTKVSTQNILAVGENACYSSPALWPGGKGIVFGKHFFSPYSSEKWVFLFIAKVRGRVGL